MCESPKRYVEEEFLEILFGRWDTDKGLESVPCQPTYTSNNQGARNYSQASSAQKWTDGIDADLLVAVFGC